MFDTRELEATFAALIGTLRNAEGSAQSIDVESNGLRLTLTSTTGAEGRAFTVYAGDVSELPTLTIDSSEAAGIGDGNEWGIICRKSDPLDGYDGQVRLATADGEVVGVATAYSAERVALANMDFDEPGLSGSILAWLKEQSWYTGRGYVYRIALADSSPTWPTGQRIEAQAAA